MKEFNLGEGTLYCEHNCLKIQGNIYQVNHVDDAKQAFEDLTHALKSENSIILDVVECNLCASVFLKILLKWLRLIVDSKAKLLIKAGSYEGEAIPWHETLYNFISDTNTSNCEVEIEISDWSKAKESQPNWGTA